MGPVTIRVAATGGVRLAVRVWDPAPAGRVEAAPFVLVHGLASCARLWDGVAAELARGGHPVAAVDQRGHGASDKPDDGYDFPTVCADLAAVVGALGWERPVLVGQSWGANVVLELAVRRPSLTRGVALVDGGLFALADHLDTWEAAAEVLAPPPLEGTPLDALERELRAAHPDWPAGGIEGALACFEVRADNTVAPLLTRERHMAILRHLWAHRPDACWPRLRVPALLIPADDGSPLAGRRRRAVAAAEAAIRLVRTRWFTGDHDLHAQHPTEVAEVLRTAATDGFFR
jgi:pimeloyl-ACP methyl ester carboxylesterase